MTSRTTFHRIPIAALAAAALLLASAPARCADQVMILHSYHQHMPWTDDIMQGMFTILDTADPPPNIHVEYMDSKRHPPENISAAFESMLRDKYRDTTFDAVLVSDNNALDFVLARRNVLFPGVPVVFCAVNNFSDDMLEGHTGITGVVEDIDIRGTIALAARTVPGLSRIIAITDATPTGKANRQLFEKAVDGLPDNLSFEVWDNHAAEELQRDLAVLPKDTAVVLFTFHKDRNGTFFTINEFLEFITRSSNRPVFSFWKHYLGHGVLGGNMVYGITQGEKAAEATLKILQGIPAEDIPIIRKSPNVPIFDYTQLNHFGISPDILPGGSIILNKPHSFFFDHKVETITGSVVLLLLIGALVFMGLSIVRRRKAEIELREQEQRMRFFFDQAADAVYVFNPNGRIRRANGQACRDTGYSKDELEKMNVADLDADTDAPEILHAFFQSLPLGESVTVESRHRRRDDTVFPVEITIAHVAISGEHSILAIARDTTLRSAAENALKRSEERYQAMFEHMSSGVAVYEAVDDGEDFMFKAFNRAGERIDNLDRRELIGRRLTELFPGVREFGLLDVFRRVWRTGMPEEHPVSMYRDNRIQGWRDNYVYRLPGGEIVAIYDDVTEQKKTEEALMLSEERLNLALDVVSDGVWDWRVDTNEVYFSPRWYTMLGWEPYELPQDFETWKKLVHPDDLPAARKTIAEHLQTGEPFQMEFRMRTRDGETRWILGRGKMVERDESGKARRMLGTHMDITERKHFEKTLTEAKEAAEAADSAKNVFLANMSHEVRTPLNGIMGMLQLLKTTPLDEEQDTYADNALLSSKRLTRLLSDILDLSRIEAGKPAVFPELFDFADTMDSLKSLFAPAAEHKGLVFNFHVDPNIPNDLIGDALRLQQVLSNLIGNAVKFTESGRVDVSVHPIPTVHFKQFRILFIIADTGIGIPDDKLDMLFEHFTQAGGGYARRHQGAGLGLSITKNLVTLMNGVLGVENRLGRGTIFHLSLPFDISAPLSRSAETTIQKKNGRKLNVLLAEDDDITLFATTKLLEKLGHTIRAAKNGRQALETLRTEPCDLVLMDIQMPIMDGVEATRAVRRGEAGNLAATVPIIAVTAYAMIGDRDRFLSAGMNDYIAKPLELNHLKRILDETVDRTGDRPGDRTAPTTH